MQKLPIATDHSAHSLCTVVKYKISLVIFRSHLFYDSLPLIAHLTEKTCFWFQKMIYHIKITYRHIWLIYDEK